MLFIESFLQIKKDVLINVFLAVFAFYIYKIDILTINVFFIYLLVINFLKTLLIRFFGETLKLSPKIETNIHVITDILIVIFSAYKAKKGYNISLDQCLVLVMIGQFLNWFLTYILRKSFYKLCQITK